jgi:hypothetical protein
MVLRAASFLDGCFDEFLDEYLPDKANAHKTAKNDSRAVIENDAHIVRKNSM